MADEKNADVGRPSLTPAEVRAEKRALQRMQHRQPPPSMWTAPQSRIPPPNPADIPTSEVAEKYFRRVAVPNMLNGPPPTRGQRIANIAGGVLGCTVGLYLILLHDFGTPDHVFMPIRRFFSLDPFNPLALSSAEKQWAQQKGIDKARTSDGQEKIV